MASSNVVFPALFLPATIDATQALDLQVVKAAELRM